MHPLRIALLVVNIVGGAAVLGSYALGIATHDNPASALWGNIPAGWKPLYTASMLMAAVGYLMCFPVLLRNVDPDSARLFGGQAGYLTIIGLYVLVLLASTLWMPLTFAYVGNPSPQLWFAVRSVLALTGIGAIGLVAACIGVAPISSGTARTVAVIGAVMFAAHTVILDAIVWPALYR